MRRVWIEDEDGNPTAERLTISGDGDEKPKSSLVPTLDWPHDGGFASPVLVSSGNPVWAYSSRGKVWTNWWKYKDTTETDPSADYFVYRRKVIADANAGSFVRTSDLQSWITDKSNWKFIAESEWEPRVTRSYGGDQCSSADLRVGTGFVSLGYTVTHCDIVKSMDFSPFYNVDHWTRYEAQKSTWEIINWLVSTNWGFIPLPFKWYEHDGDARHHGFQIVVKVKPGTTPYWHDYADAFFCSVVATGCYEDQAYA